jgi:hypothetical protein
MTTDSVSEPRRLLAETRSLARQVRLDQRLTWVTLLILAAVTLLAIPFDVHFMRVHCLADGSCQFSRRGVLYFWPAALLLSYAAIAVTYIRVARSRGLGARVLPYTITGAALTVLFTGVYLWVWHYFDTHPAPEHPFPAWVMVLDRLIAPAGIIGIALLVLARLERNLALALFTGIYLLVVLVPVDFGWVGHGDNTRMFWVPQQVINGTVLLLGALGFALARQRGPRPESQPAGQRQR